MDDIPRSPIIDTGPLFDFLLWRFSEEIRNPQLLSKLICLRSDSERRSVLWYLGVSKPIVTCPQVLAEIHGHAERKLYGSYRPSFWRAAKTELTELGLTEKLIQLLQMPVDTLSFLGPTDTALIQIAFQSPNPDQVIFTQDMELAGKCRIKQISTLTISEVNSLWQQFGSQ